MSIINKMEKGNKMVKKEKILLIAGCSHAVGSEIDGNEDSDYNRQHSFGALIAKKLNRRVIHVAQVGAANTGVARQVLNWFHTRYDPDTMNVNVLCCWTEPTRLEIPSETERNYQSANPNTDWYEKGSDYFYKVIIGYHGGDEEEQRWTPDLHKFMANHQPYLEYQTYNLILQVQYLLQAKKIPYMMLNAMPFFLDDINCIKNLLPLIDHNKYYQLNNKDEAFYQKYQRLGYVNEKAKYWHHGEEPHKLFADELINFNEEYKCLKR